MSTIRMCNICGKNESQTGVIFTNSPNTLEVRNYKGETYRLDLFVTIQKDSDYRKLKTLLFTPRASLSMEVNTTTIDVPNPHICLACRKNILTNIAKYGMVDNSYSLTDQEMRTIMTNMARKDYQEQITYGNAIVQKTTTTKKSSRNKEELR